MSLNTEIVATGDKWIGYEVTPTEDVIKELIDKSNKFLLLTVFIITESMVLKNIEKALKRGVNVEIFIHNDKEFFKSIQPDLLKFQEKYPHIKVFLAPNEFLHAKVLISDKKKVLIGSANLTKAGLSKNYELGILLDDSNIAYKLESIIKRLIQ